MQIPETTTAKSVPANLSGVNIDLVALLVFTVLPCPIMWFGLYVLKSAAWTLVLYHTLCLVPVIVWGWPLWRNTLKWPTANQLAILITASLLFSAFTILLYVHFGDLFLSSQQAFALLIRLGYTKYIFIPLSLYFVFVNSVLEEMFWRGVVLNRLDAQNGFKQLGLIWSSVAYGVFHYPILRLVVYPGWAEVGTLLLVIYGAMLAFIYRRSRSIVLTSLCHAFLTDFTAIVLIVALFHRLHVTALF